MNISKSENRALELIDRIYETALQPALWPETLIRLGNALGCMQECMLVHDPATQFSAVCAPRRDPDYVRSFRDVWMHAIIGRAATIRQRRNRHAAAHEPVPTLMCELDGSLQALASGSGEELAQHRVEALYPRGGGP